MAAMGAPQRPVAAVGGHDFGLGPCVDGSLTDIMANRKSRDMAILCQRNRTVRERGRETRFALCCGRRGLCRAFEGWIVAKHK
jgi:hypothetical protein